jgi:hypothetical protein
MSLPLPIRERLGEGSFFPQLWLSTLDPQLSTLHRLLFESSAELLRRTDTPNLLATDSIE